jgi:hypothetical protein
MADFTDVIFTDDTLLDAAGIVCFNEGNLKPLFFSDLLADMTTAKMAVQDAMVNDALKDMTTAHFYLPFDMKNDAFLAIREQMPVWEGGSVFNLNSIPSVDRAGRIFGTVKVQGVLQNKARVSLYFRKTGALIQSTFTNENGEFLFECGLNRNVSDYYAVAITEQPYNAQVFDKLTPI